MCPEPADNRRSIPVVLANTSLSAAPSEMMAAVATSPAGAWSKVRVPEVVNCPDGDTVTVGQRHTSYFRSCEFISAGR